MNHTIEFDPDKVTDLLRVCSPDGATLYVARRDGTYSGSLSAAAAVLGVDDHPWARAILAIINTPPANR